MILSNLSALSHLGTNILIFLLTSGAFLSFSPLCGEGKGNPLQYSCPENPVNRGAWWAAVYGVAQSWIRLKRLSMHACIGERNGNPLQYPCLENPRDGGAWWAAVYEVAQSRTRLKRLSSSSIPSLWLPSLKTPRFSEERRLFFWQL